METKIHNVNFYKTKPLGVNCLAANNKDKLLALSRTDASIEIWSVISAPFLLKYIPGVENGSVEALSWYKGRLISTGLSGTLIEWDLHKLVPKQSALLTGYAAWCLDVNEEKSLIAIGTEQGYVNLYKIDDDFTYDKLFDKQEGRILCCKFDKTGDLLATGSDGMIRVWNVKTGHAVHRLSLRQQGKTNIVWDVAILSDSTIISADSNGKITFWDGNIGEQIESFKTHRSDILSFCISESEDSIYCSGVDPLIVNLIKVKMSVKDNMEAYKWVKHTQRHIHEHDVRCLALVGKKLISVGADGYLTFSSFPPKWLMRIPPISASPRAKASMKNKLLLLRHNKHLEIWRLGSYKKTKKGEASIQSLQNVSKASKGTKKEEVVEQDSVIDILLRNAGNNSNRQCAVLDKNPVKLITLESKHGKHIVCCDITDEGDLFAYATDTELRIFRLDFDEEETPMLSKLVPLTDDFENINKISFADNETLIVSTPIGLAVLHVDVGAARAVLLQNLSLNEYLKDRANQIMVSATGKYLAVTDGKGCCCIFSREQKMKKYTFNRSLPKTKAPISALRFNADETKLVVVCTDQKIIECDMTDGRIDASINEQLPEKWTKRCSAVDCILFHPTQPGVLILYDQFSLTSLHKSAKKKSKPPNKMSKKKVSEELDYTMKIFPYKYLAAFQFIDQGEAVAVRVSPEDIIAQLPPILKVKRHIVV